jgi:hypothetical protein
VVIVFKNISGLKPIFVGENGEVACDQYYRYNEKEHFVCGDTDIWDNGYRL